MSIRARDLDYFSIPTFDGACFSEGLMRAIPPVSLRSARVQHVAEDASHPRPSLVSRIVLRKRRSSPNGLGPPSDFRVFASQHHGLSSATVLPKIIAVFRFPMN